MTPICDDILRYLFTLRKATKGGVQSSDIPKLADVFHVTENTMIVECGTLEQGELIVWNRTQGGTVGISPGGVKYCQSVLDL